MTDHVSDYAIRGTDRKAAKETYRISFNRQGTNNKNFHKLKILNMPISILERTSGVSR